MMGCAWPSFSVEDSMPAQRGKIVASIEAIEL
jgi:hypothetical protein